MVLSGVAVMLALAVGVAIGRRRRPRVGGPGAAELAAIHRSIESLHRAHEHHQAETDRRLAALGESMARTENETRMLAVAARPVERDLQQEEPCR